MVYCFLSFMFHLFTLGYKSSGLGDLAVLASLFTSFGVTTGVRSLSFSLLLAPLEYRTWFHIFPAGPAEEKLKEKQFSLPICCFLSNYVPSMHLQSTPPNPGSLQICKILFVILSFFIKIFLIILFFIIYTITSFGINSTVDLYAPYQLIFSLITL